MNIVKICDKIIEFSFYALFLLVPLVLSKDTSELFELNKMWLTWGLTVIIAAFWFTKMILQKKIYIQKTPLDIPILLFLSSQILSTIFSWDIHTSIWGYYSRFNGGLLSIISYIFLYYAFLSNFSNKGVAKEEGLPTARSSSAEGTEKIERALAGGKLLTEPHMVKRLLLISLISGLIVSLWGIPSHFGYDPTCFLFRGTFDTSCWTADFVPTVRIFSTLGQPNWLAAYLAFLIPIAVAFFIINLKSISSGSRVKNHESGIMNYVLSKKFILNSLFLLLASLFYVDLLFTLARSGILALWASLAFFFLVYIFIERKKTDLKLFNLARPIIIVAIIFSIITFVVGAPIPQIRKLTLPGIKENLQKVPPANPSPTSNQNSQSSTSPSIQNSGITDSGDIRLNVWEGAINTWKANPIFGTGVETFAYAYYAYKPVSHNITSEWNFLYNKAHNEYLNYLATTGIFGLGTYLGMIIFFLVLCIKYYVSSIKKGIHDTYYILLNTALLAGYISILITNFFGFSVVIMNIYLFMVPAFIFVLTGMVNQESKIKNQESERIEISLYQWTGVFFIILASLFIILNLFRFWQADIAFALGYNLNRAGEYQKGYDNLQKAIRLRGEPVYKDELSITSASFAVGLINDNKNTNDPQVLTLASNLAQEAIALSDQLVIEYPKNIVFWKTRVRVFYTLSQVDSRYFPKGLEAIEKAYALSPNDANISYNLGVLYGQNNQIDKGIQTLERTVTLKPDYAEAYYALGLFYRSKAVDENGIVVKDETLNQKAISQMQYILEHINSNYSPAKESIQSWSI